MDKAAQECWENHSEREHIKNQLEWQVKYLTEQYDMVNIELAKREEKIEVLEKKVKRNRRLAIGGGIGFFGLLGAGIVILK